MRTQREAARGANMTNYILDEAILARAIKDAADLRSRGYSDEEAAERATPGAWKEFRPAVGAFLRSKAEGSRQLPVSLLPQSFQSS